MAESATPIPAPNMDAASVQQKSSPGRFREKTSRKKKTRVYGVGEASAGDSVVPVADSGVVAGDSVVEAGLVASVVVGGLVAAGVAAGSVVSVFCSHAARRAALARMQIYFFIVLMQEAYCCNRLIGARQFLTAFDSYFQQQILDKRRLKRGLVFEAVRLRHCLTSKPPVARVNATYKGGLFFTGAFKTEIGEQFHIAKRDVCERLSSRARVRRGHVCHAIMRNAFLDINWIKVCSGSRCFRAAALINGNIHQHAARLHFPQHLASN
jgi:hypothetical protein